MTPRALDSFGLALALGVAAAVLGGGVVAVYSNVVTAGELLLILGVGGVLLAAYRPRSASPSVHNTYAHGAARLADEDEARAAAMRRGASKPLDAMDFND